MTVKAHTPHGGLVRPLPTADEQFGVYDAEEDEALDSERAPFPSRYVPVPKQTPSAYEFTDTLPDAQAHRRFLEQLRAEVWGA